MEPCKIRGTTHPSSHAQGLEGKEIPSPSGRGRKMSLTSPLIDRDFSPIGHGHDSQERLRKRCTGAESLLRLPEIVCWRSPEQLDAVAIGLNNLHLEYRVFLGRRVQFYGEIAVFKTGLLFLG